MAKIILGLGLAHAPQLHTAVEDWHIRADRDRTNGVPHVYRGKLMPWQDLYEERKDEAFDKQISLKQQKEKLDASWATIDKLVEKYEEKKPDYAVIFGNDQHEIMVDGQIQPPFTIITSETVENMPRTEEQLGRVRKVPGIELSDHGHLPPEHQVYPAAPELAHQLVAGTMADNFDVAISSKVPKADADQTWTDGMSHAFGFVYRNIMQDKVIPHVPIAINTFFGPNQPTARRCLEFGKSIGRAVQSWDEDVTVALMCSGGLSHFAIDEQLDLEFIEALKEKDFDTLTGHEESWYQSGTSELKNWIALAGALSVAENIEVSMSDYHAFYRTEAGTGNGCGFVSWE